MLFPTHLLAGYLVGRRFSRFPAWALAGAALPDLVDKPLGAIGATALYQSVGHSALALLGVGSVAVLAGGGALGGRRLAVGIGWASHLGLDVLGIALNGRPENWVSLLWPVLEKPNPLGLDPVSFYAEYLWSWSFYAEIAVWAVGAYVLARSPTVRRCVRSVIRSAPGHSR